MTTETARELDAIEQEFMRRERGGRFDARSSGLRAMTDRQLVDLETATLQRGASANRDYAEGLESYRADGRSLPPQVTCAECSIASRDGVLVPRVCCTTDDRNSNRRIDMTQKPNTNHPVAAARAANLARMRSLGLRTDSDTQEERRGPVRTSEYSMTDSDFRARWQAIEDQDDDEERLTAKAALIRDASPEQMAWVRRRARLRQLEGTALHSDATTHPVARAREANYRRMLERSGTPTPAPSTLHSDGDEHPVTRARRLDRERAANAWRK